MVGIVKKKKKIGKNNNSSSRNNNSNNNNNNNNNNININNFIPFHGSRRMGESKACKGSTMRSEIKHQKPRCQFTLVE